MAIREPKIEIHSWRFYLLIAGFALLAVIVLWRAADIQIMNSEFYMSHAESRQHRTKTIAAPRGVIYDRNQLPLAVSTPVFSIWVNPRALEVTSEDIAKVAAYLKMDVSKLREKIRARADKSFVYLQRHVDPQVKADIASLKIPGVFFDKEFKRFYPERDFVSQVVGMTNIDDKGLEGIELIFNDWLKGTNGVKRVVQDNRRNIIEDIELIRKPVSGNTLALSIDRRLQYLTYKELQSAYLEHGAKSASAVIIEPTTGEIFAMVNLPSFNPNNRAASAPSSVRNRAATDTFEPGSTIKPFALAAILDSGIASGATKIDTSPGWYSIGKYLVQDSRNYGVMTVSEILQKSSNVGTSKLVMQLDDEALPSLLARCGFGMSTGVEFPGESSGVMPFRERWRPIEKATLSFGYGLSATTLQIARAYAVLANGGKLPLLSVLKKDEGEASTQVMNAKIANIVRKMMVGVTSIDGTAHQAKIDGYHVAGKTGTAKKVGANGYEDDKYISVFAGMVPASAPKFVMVVVLDEPSGDSYYGGVVAAPVFRNVMASALRLYNVGPDDLQTSIASDGHVAKEGT